MWRFIGGLAALGALTLAACGGGTDPTQVEVACPQLYVAPPALIYPQNGSGGIPDGNFNIVTTSAYGEQLGLMATGQSEILTGSNVQAPLPLPSSTVTPSPAQAPQAYPVGALQAATNYTIVGIAAVAPGCPDPVVTLGTFTTQ